MTVRKKATVIILFQIVSIFAIGGAIWKSNEADSKASSAQRTRAQIEYLRLLEKHDIVKVDELPKSLRLDHYPGSKAGTPDTMGALIFFGIAFVAQIGVFFFTVITGWPRKELTRV